MCTFNSVLFKFLIPLLLLYPKTQAFGSEKKPMSVTDFASLKSVSSSQLSPDGQLISCVVSQVDLEDNCTHSDIMLISVDDGQVRRLTSGYCPHFSPDGNMIAYMGSKNDRSGIWLYDFEKDSTRFLSTVYFSAHFLGHLAEKNFEWSPNGKWIAYVGAEPPTESFTENNVRVINRILYKTRGGRTRPSFSDNRCTHIWLVPTVGGESKIITPGKYNEHSISWSPDSRKIAFISNRSDNPDNNYQDDLWSIDISTGKIKQLTYTLGPEFHPKWSPDGKYIAYLAMDRALNTKDNPAENTHLYILPSNGGISNCLTDQDQHILSISWHPDEQFIYFTTRTKGMHPISRVSIKSKQVENIIKGEFQVFEFTLDASGKSILYTQIDMTHPIEIWASDINGGNSHQITKFNESFVNKFSIQDAEMFWYKSFDKIPIQGWLIKPIELDSRKSYPLILHLHGGPHNMWGYRFDEGFQLLSSNSYAVLLINHRGSRGYGQAFSDACVLNWGGGDYKDLMAGVDYVLDNYRWLDKDRLGVTGVSYGGFMTNWIITQTNRFKAAIPVSSISNLISFYGTSLYNLLIEVEFNGYPWDNYDLLWQWSPLRYVKNVITPTLFFHGENDQEVPISQTEQMFNALKKLGVETVFVRYPGEGHGWAPSWTPEHRVDFNRRVVEWFDRYVKGKR